MFDGQGSERTVTNSSQTVTGTISYDAYGEEIGHTGSSTDPYTYNGQLGYRNDDDDLLAMVGARYYDVTAGRFISRDTNLSQAPYAYCGGDPVNGADPSGHLQFSIGLGAIGGSFLFGGWADAEFIVDTAGNYGVGGHLGGGLGMGFGGSVGIGGGVAGGYITPGWDLSVGGGGFAGVGGGVNGTVTSGPGWSLAGGGGRMGPTTGVGVYAGPQLGYTVKQGNIWADLGTLIGWTLSCM